MELDDAYANGAYIAGAEGYPPRWAIAAKGWVEVQSAKGLAKLDIAYGSGARQTFDLFGQDAAPKGLMVFVHGGYWLKFDRSSWSHLAAGPLAQGWAVAIPSYDLCPSVSIADITRQIATAVEVIAERNEGPLALAGHSAGGHLAAMVASAGWADRPAIQSLTAISGLFDLGPLLETSANDWLDLTPAMARSLSPINNPPPGGLPVLLGIGRAETDAFRYQMGLYAKTCRQLNCPTQTFESPNADHFQIIGD